MLIAATAIGLGMGRELPGPLWQWTNYSASVEAGSFVAIALEVARWIVVALPLAWAWTIALLMIGLQGSREGVRNRISLPGLAACGAATVALMIDAISLLAVLLAFAVRGDGLGVEVGDLLVGCILEIDPGMGTPGIAVTIAWIGLAVSGRWRPEPSWIDRAGRLAGVGWVALMMLRPWVISLLQGYWS